MATINNGRLLPWGLSSPFRVAPGAHAGPGITRALNLLGVDEVSTPQIAHTRAMVTGTPGTPGGELLAYANLNFNGTCRIAGTVKAGGMPLRDIWVHLFPLSMQTTCILSALTDEGGTFTFDHIAYGLYIIEAVDRSAAYNGGIRTFVLAY